MIGSSAQDLVNRIRTIPEFGNRVSVTAGGKESDPMMYQGDYPKCWIVYRGDDNVSDVEGGECAVSVKAFYIVRILVQYGTQSDLLTNQFPLLETVISSVIGYTPTVGATKWRYEGQTVTEIDDDRLAYDQLYSTEFTIAQ